MNGTVDLSAGEPTVTVRCIVSGRVQGVFYRAATAERARGLGLDGWARNLANGDVEVVASGAASAVSELARWLWHGPARAAVASVRVEERTDPVPAGFTTG